MGTKNGSGIPNAAFVLDDDDISCKGPTLPAVQQQQHKKTTSAITSISPDVFNSVEVKNGFSNVVHSCLIDDLSFLKNSK